MHEGEDKLPLRIGPVHRAPVDVDGLLVHRTPSCRGISGTDGDWRTVDTRQDELFRLAGGVDLEAAGRFGAALQNVLVVLAVPRPCLALIGGAKHAAIT